MLDAKQHRGSLMIDRRRVLQGTAGLALAGAAPGLAWAQGAPTRGGSAILAIDSDPETLNMAITTSNSSGDVGAKIFEGLTYLAPDYRSQPSLATSWTVSADNKTYTFNLRRGVKWHDGRDFTSADVKFTYEEMLAKLHPRMALTLRRLEPKIATPDANTVVFELKEPFAPFLMLQTPFEAPILPKHLYENTDVKTNPANDRPIGTGPFRFAQWNRGASLRLVRNETYWDTGKPYLDAVVFQIIPQGPNRSTALETGEVDLLISFYLSRPDADRLKANPRLQHKQAVITPSIYFVMFNTETPALSTKLGRQALAMAINRDIIVAQAMQGLAKPGVGAFGQGFPWLFNPDVSFAGKYPLNAQRARAMLTEARVAENTPLRLVYDTARPPFVTAAQIIRDNLRQVGLNVTLVPLERSVMVQKVYTEREYDLTLQSFTSGGDPSIGYHRLYASAARGTQFVNATGYSNAEVDRLLAQAATAATPEARAPLYKQLQVILNEDLPSLVLFEEETIDFASRRLAGLWKAAEPRDRWGDVYMVR